MSEISVHLKEWLVNAAAICGDDDIDHESGVENVARIVGSYILNLGEEASLGDVKRELSHIYEEDSVYNNNTTLIELILVHAVSEGSDQRGEFVEGIMNMGTETQMYLMQVIQDHHSGEEEGDEEEAEDEVEEENELSEENAAMNMLGAYPANDMVPMAVVATESVPTPIHAPPEWSMHADGLNSSTCVTCAEKDAHIKKLQQDAKQSIAKNSEEIFRLKEEVGVLNNKLVDMEVLMMQKDSAIFENNQALKDLAEQKERNEQIACKSNKQEEQILVLQDELELLKPQAAAAVSTSAAAPATTKP